MLLNIQAIRSADIIEGFQFNMELQALYQTADLALNQVAAVEGDRSMCM